MAKVQTCFKIRETQHMKIVLSGLGFEVKFLNPRPHIQN